MIQPTWDYAMIHYCTSLAGLPWGALLFHGLKRGAVDTAHTHAHDCVVDLTVCWTATSPVPNRHCLCQMRGDLTARSGVTGRTLCP